MQMNCPACRGVMLARLLVQTDQGHVLLRVVYVVAFVVYFVILRKHQEETVLTVACKFVIHL
jgi:hypothetical protein